MSTQPDLQNASTHPYTLPPLPYGYAELEPIIDEATMHLHHDKHHQAYTDGTNAALAKHPQWQGLAIEDVLRRLAEVPEEIRQAVRNQGGGYANHNLFWECLTPRGGRGPEGELADGIEARSDLDGIGVFCADCEHNLRPSLVKIMSMIAKLPLPKQNYTPSE